MKQWTKSYGNYPDGVNQFAETGKGTWDLIYNECWGIASKYTSSGTVDGYVFACGTGIEGCKEEGINYTDDLKKKCAADPR